MWQPCMTVVTFGIQQEYPGKDSIMSKELTQQYLTTLRDLVKMRFSWSWQARIRWVPDLEMPSHLFISFSKLFTVIIGRVDLFAQQNMASVCPFSSWFQGPGALPMFSWSFFISAMLMFHCSDECCTLLCCSFQEDLHLQSKDKVI